MSMLFVYCVFVIFFGSTCITVQRYGVVQMTNAQAAEQSDFLLQLQVHAGCEKTHLRLMQINCANAARC